jgi:hypothetical protein
MALLMLIKKRRGKIYPRSEALFLIWSWSGKTGMLRYNLARKRRY